jgi:hypothetical protein
MRCRLVPNRVALQADSEGWPVVRANSVISAGRINRNCARRGWARSYRVGPRPTPRNPEGSPVLVKWRGLRRCEGRFITYRSARASKDHPCIFGLQTSSHSPGTRCVTHGRDNKHATEKHQSESMSLPVDVYDRIDDDGLFITYISARASKDLHCIFGLQTSSHSPGPRCVIQQARHRSTRADRI